MFSAVALKANFLTYQSVIREPMGPGWLVVPFGTIYHFDYVTYTRTSVNGAQYGVVEKPLFCTPCAPPILRA